MSDKPRYIVLASEELHLLEEHVNNAHMRFGYVPQGGVCVRTHYGAFGPSFYQAMVLRATPPRKPQAVAEVIDEAVTVTGFQPGAFVSVTSDWDSGAFDDD